MNRRLLVRAVLVAVLALPQLAAICVPSGAWEVAATPEGSLIIFDSARNLARSDDSGQTWYATDSLPLHSTRMSPETCLEDGRCFRVRADLLGIEESTGSAWTTAWEYPADRVEFAGRQLPGPCGDGHGWVGLTGVMVGPEGGDWALLVPAGADGMMGLSRSGEWVRGVYGTPSSLDFAPAELDLLPEAVALGFGVVLLILLFGVLDFRKDAVRFIAASAGWAAVILTWWSLGEAGVSSLGALIGFSAIPFALMLIGCRMLSCDAAELFLGLFLGGAVGGGIIAIGSAHDSTSWGITLAAIASLVTVFAGFGVRGYLQRPSVNPVRLLAVGTAAIVGAFLAYLPFGAWADGAEFSKRTADLLAVGVGVVFLGISLVLGRRLRRT